LKHQTIAIVCDVHVPDHDRPTVRAFFEWCKHNKPDEIILAGDILELESCSGHGKIVRPPLLLEDRDAGRSFLDDVRKHNPRARLTYLEGNHETRLARKVVDRIPELSGAVSLPEMLELRQRGIAWHPYGEVIRRGKLGITHGAWTPTHHAKKHLEEFGCSIAYGHTHRPQTYTRGKVGGTTYGAFGLPCMRTLNPAWLNNHPSGWMHGFGILYVMPTGHFNLYTVMMHGGRFIYGGREYGARFKK
jgi:predicted phosphodiesterase